MTAVTKRSVMTLLSGTQDLHSHRTRIVLAEKGVTVDVLEIDNSEELQEELMEANPYGTTPTLLDRDLILYQSRIIMEYLDERFPHPPLLPVYPVARANSRLMMHRVDHDWYNLVDIIEGGSQEEADDARQQLKDSLMAIAPLFSQMPFFMSEEFSMVDCSIAPVLWRLPMLGISLPAARTKAFRQYMDDLFARESFQASLTEVERELQEVD